MQRDGIELVEWLQFKKCDPTGAVTDIYDIYHVALKRNIGQVRWHGKSAGYGACVVGVVGVIEYQSYVQIGLFCEALTKLNKIKRIEKRDKIATAGK